MSIYQIAANFPPIPTMPCSNLLNLRELHRDGKGVLQRRCLHCPGEHSLSLLGYFMSPSVRTSTWQRSMHAHAARKLADTSSRAVRPVCWPQGYNWLRCTAQFDCLAWSGNVQSTTPEWIFGPKCQQGPITIPDTSATWTCGIQITGRYACSGGQSHPVTFHSACAMYCVQIAFIRYSPTSTFTSKVLMHQHAERVSMLCPSRDMEQHGSTTDTPSEDTG